MFCKSNEVAIFLRLGGSPSDLSTLNSVSSWSSLSVTRLDKAASYSACQGVTAHDARYASPEEERARPIYRRVKHPRVRAGARRSKVERVKLVACWVSSLLEFFCAPARGLRRQLLLLPPEPGFGAEPQFYPRRGPPLKFFSLRSSP